MCWCMFGICAASVVIRALTTRVPLASSISSPYLKPGNAFDDKGIALPTLSGMLVPVSIGGY